MTSSSQLNRVPTDRGAFLRIVEALETDLGRSEQELGLLL